MTKLAAIAVATALGFGILVGAGATSMAACDAVARVAAGHARNSMDVGHVMSMPGGVAMPAANLHMHGSPMAPDQHRMYR